MIFLFECVCELVCRMIFTGWYDSESLFDKLDVFYAMR